MFHYHSILKARYRRETVLGEISISRPNSKTIIFSGKWILLEDVHQAAGDCFPLIVQLIERSVLVIAGHGAPITPHPNFQLFLTERTQPNSNMSNVSILYPKVHLVRMDPNYNSISSLESVITAHHPTMKKTIQQIPIKVYQSGFPN